ncbi:hypothetical protein [Nocardioides gansuensis]|nr:hypothetical protein [Nocardioides gansuensis]
MRDQKTNELVCTWVSVTDESGRTHMEARWATPCAARQPHAA